METSDASDYRGECMEGQREDNDPRKMTAEGSRHTSDTPQQPSAYGDQTSTLKERSEMMKEMDDKITKEMFKKMKEMDDKITKEMFKRMKEMDDKIRKGMFEMMEEMDDKIRKGMFEMMEEMYDKIRNGMFEIMKEMDDKIRKERLEMMKEMDDKITTLTDPVNTPLHLPDSYSRAFPGRAIQIQHQKKEEYEELKEKNKNLEARYQELLAKMMAMHQHSEDVNDPLHLSAVLKRYKMLQLQQWEKVRSSMPCRWTYEQGCRIIKKLFDACEKDMQQRTDNILKALDISLWNNALSEEMMHDIRKFFRQPYHKNYPEVHKKIVQEAAILTETEDQIDQEFLLQCCYIYCLLLLQDPPVKAEWKMNRRYLEHVDKKDPVYWRNPSLLWPIMKCGENVIVKGVVWDQKMT